MLILDIILESLRFRTQNLGDFRNEELRPAGLGVGVKRSIRGLQS